MINKPFDLIDKSDIDSLIQNQVGEKKTLEYKQELPSDLGDSKKEFLNDVSSFANTSGGDLIYGIKDIRDDKNKPTGIPEITGLKINFDFETRRLENILRDSIEPRIAGINFKLIEGYPQGNLIIIRIPKSWNSPHMVKPSSRFYARNNAGKYLLDVNEIRSAFIASESLAERIRQFRAERIAKIIADETPVQLEYNPKIVLHVLPIGCFTSGINIDINLVANNPSSLQPIFSDGWNQRYNFDGIVKYSGVQPTISYSYTQLFRNGAIEAVDAYFLEETRDGRKLISSVDYEEELIKYLQQYLKLQQQLGLNTPVLIMLSLLGVRDYIMHIGDGWDHTSHKYAIDRDNLVIHEIFVDDYATKASDILRPAFDAIWQACGMNYCQHYDASGNRIRYKRYGL